jgi:hypothetical protein
MSETDPTKNQGRTRVLTKSKNWELFSGRTSSKYQNLELNVFSGVRFTLFFDLCVMFYRSLVDLLSFSLWPLFCLYPIDLGILVTHLVSPKSSWISSRCTVFFIKITPGCQYTICLQNTLLSWIGDWSST